MPHTTTPLMIVGEPAYTSGALSGLIFVLVLSRVRLLGACGPVALRIAALRCGTCGPALRLCVAVPAALAAPLLFPRFLTKS